MATRTLSSFDVRDLWPATWGDSGTLVITINRDIVSEDAVHYPATENAGKSLRSLGFHWESAITVTGGRATTAAITGLVNTDTATPAHTATYNVYIYDSKGAKCKKLNSKPYHIHESLNGNASSFTWEQWVASAEFSQSRAQLPIVGDIVTMQAMVDAAVSPHASTVVEGLNYLSAPSASASHPIAVENNDPRIKSVVNISTYGVTGDGTTDDTTAFQAAVDAIGSNASLIVPANYDIKLTNTIFMSGKVGILIEGSQGDAYGKTYPRFTWAGSSGGQMFRMVNCSSCQISGFYFAMGTAAIGIDVDQDGDRTALAASMPLGDTEVTCSGARFKGSSVGFNATDVGRTITVPGAGPGGADLVTTIQSVSTASKATLAVAASTGVIGETITILSPYGNNTSTSCRFERLTFVKSSASSSTVGIRISYWSTSNNERHQIDRCSVFIGGNLATLTTAGTAFKIGDSTGGGTNALNILFISPYWFGPSVGIDAAGGSFNVINGQSNYASIDYKISGTAHILSHRSESQRQFMVLNGARVTMESVFIGYGAWDVSFPLIYADATVVLTINQLEFSDQSGITLLDANPLNANRLVMLHPYFVGSSLTANLSNWGGGVTILAPSTDVGLFLGGNAGASIQMSGTTVANLGFVFSTVLSTNGNGTLIYVTDAIPGRSPVVGGGTGAWCQRVNGVWSSLPAAFTGTGSGVNATSPTIAGPTISGALSHTGSTAGFFNTAATTKPTVTGSRGANAALASLLTALANLGLITDSSS